MARTKKNREIQLIGTLTEKQLKNYADFFKKNKLDKFSLQEKGLKICLSKDSPETAPAPAGKAAPAPVQESDMEQTAAAAKDQSATAPADKEGEKRKKYKTVISPIVGTYYASPAPDKPPYVHTGDSVSPDSKVCIIEAMKNMNEIEAGVSGKIVEILVKDGDAVQSDQVLMYIE
ncbi:MAG TPA: acetyl-CoA carboxylase biotin carboxyl carrier protein [Spirochaetota bacterium]|nr:acetyl-CoA carboxylase biotin carboxyl carrier protein [Spirochaetota bacterium]